jgi:cytoskeletal protein RodZ
MMIRNIRAEPCPPGSQVGAFGDKFRTERERRGFTLDEVSNVTKINSRMLKAIEDEAFDLLPGGVFNKGFVRAYAKHLGLNDEESVSEYLAALRQAQVQAQTAAWEAESPAQVRVELKPNPLPLKVSPNKTVPDERAKGLKQEVRPHVKQDTLPAHKARESTSVQAAPPQQRPPATSVVEHSEHSAPRPDSIPWKVPVLVLAVIVVAAVLWNRHSRGVQAEGATPAHLPEPRVAAANIPVKATPVVSTAPQAVATQSSSHGNPGPISGSESVSGSNSVPVSSTGKTSPATIVSGAERNAAPHDSALNRAIADHVVPDHDTVRKLASSNPAPKAAPVFTLRIRASETSWIAVVADGQSVIQETLIAPAGTSIRAAHEITVKVGNAAGVAFLLNGKEIPPQGSEAEVKTLTFDSQGLR